MILIIVSVYSFLGNTSLVGPSVYITMYSKEFGISPAVASGLVSYPNLAFGFSTSFCHMLLQYLRLTGYRFPCLSTSISENRATSCDVIFYGNGMFSFIQHEA